MKTFLIIMIGVLSACSTPHEESIQKPELTSVVHLDVEPQRICQTLQVLGTVRASESATIFPKVAGKFVSYSVQKGEFVEKGACIGYMQRDEVGYQYNPAPIYSSLSGMISELPLNEGSDVRPNTMLAKIISIRTVKMEFSVPDRYLDQITVGQDIHVKVGEQVYETAVCSLSPQVDPFSRTFLIETDIDNPKGLVVPGMFARGDVILTQKTAGILLPEEAVLAIGGEWHVYKLVNHVAVLEKVMLGMRQYGKVEILDGVQPGEKVITRGNHKVQDGEMVRSKSS